MDISLSEINVFRHVLTDVCNVLFQYISAKDDILFYPSTADKHI